MSGISLKVEGIEDLQAILREIPERDAKNLVKATVRGIATEVNKEAKKRVPTGGTGNLKRSLKVKAVRSPAFQPVFDVRAESGKGVKHDGFYWRFVEHGTGGKNPQPARPFIQPATDLVFSKMNTLMHEMFIKKLRAAVARRIKAREKATK